MRPQAVEVLSAYWRHDPLWKQFVIEAQWILGKVRWGRIKLSEPLCLGDGRMRLPSACEGPLEMGQFSHTAVTLSFFKWSLWRMWPLNWDTANVSIVLTCQLTAGISLWSLLLQVFSGHSGFPPQSKDIQHRLLGDLKWLGCIAVHFYMDHVRSHRGFNAIKRLGCSQMNREKLNVLYCVLVLYHIICSTTHKHIEEYFQQLPSTAVSLHNHNVLVELIMNYYQTN